MHLCRFHSHCQLLDRLEDWLTELIHFSLLHSPVEGYACVGASQSEADAVHLVDHHDLYTALASG